MRNFYQKGISIAELAIVVAVVGILVVIALPQFATMKRNQTLKAGIGDILSSADKARSQTLASLNSYEYGVHFQSDKVIIFKGKIFSAGATDNEDVNIISPVSISNVTLGGVSATSGNFYFNRLSASPSKTGTITITSGAYSKTITISATGVASTN